MILFMIVLLMLLIGHPLASAQTPTRVMSGYAATSGPHAVLWIARDAGLFEKNGLRTDVAYIRSGSTMAQTLVSGEIQMSQMGGPAMLAAGVAGMDVTFVEDGRSQRQIDRRDPVWFQHRHLGAFCDPQGGTSARKRHRVDPT